VSDSARLSLDGATLRASEALGRGLAARAEAAGAEGADVERVSKDLESVFASMLVKEMRRGMAEGFFGDGAVGDVYGGWFDEHVGRALGESGALDIAGLVKASLGAKESGGEERAR
jgi:Rod binding domain-containing protein